MGSLVFSNPRGTKNMTKNILLSYMNLDIQEFYYLEDLTVEEFAHVVDLHGYLANVDLPEALADNIDYVDARIYKEKCPVTQIGFSDKVTKCTTAGAWYEFKITADHTPDMCDYTFVETGIAP